MVSRARLFAVHLGQRLGLILAAVLIGGIVAEAAIRLAGLAPANFYVYDRYLGWKIGPGVAGWQTAEGRAYIRASRDGFRGPDYSVSKPPGTLRIAVLGDSFTEAQQVPEQDTFCAVARDELQSRLPPAARSSTKSAYTHVEVMNFGCDGYGTAQELIMLRRWVWRYSPDVVVLAVFTGNDIRNNSVVLEGDKCRPFMVYRGASLTFAGPFADSFWFRARCAIRFASRRFEVLNLLGDAKGLLRLQQPRRPRVKPKTTPAITAEPGLGFQIYRPPGNQAWAAAWRVTEGEIELIDREVTAHHARLLVVTLANGAQDGPDAAARVRFENWIGTPDLFYPDDRIAELGHRDGFPVLNLARPLQEYAEAHHVYLHGFPNTKPGIGHWNAAGHRLAGELIAQRLAELLALPDASSRPVGSLQSLADEAIQRRSPE